jgi:glutaredoxin
VASGCYLFVEIKTCAIDPNSLYILKLLIIVQFYQMLRKVQFMRSITALGMAIGTVATLVATVRANPSLPASGNTIIAPQPAISNSAPKPQSNSTKPLAREPHIDTVSGASETALVEYLAANDVKFYGAYWCSHCQEQKSLFGAAAAAKLPYIECAADGENSQRQLCKDKDIKYFPTWVIGGKYFTGTKDLKEIAKLAGYKGAMKFKYRK